MNTQKAKSNVPLFHAKESAYYYYYYLTFERKRTFLLPVMLPTHPTIPHIA